MTPTAHNETKTPEATQKVEPTQETKVRLIVENSVKLDAETPIPIQYGARTVFSSFGKKYIPFLGKDDTLPNLLLEARLTSTTQAACLSTIAQSVVGSGLLISVPGSTAEKPLLPNNDWLTWLTSVNNEHDTFKEICAAIVDGFGMQGNQFIEIKKGKLGKTPFMKVYCHNMQYTRLAEPDKGDISENVYISRDFAKKGYRASYIDKVPCIPLWSDNLLDKTSCWKKNDDGTESTMIHFKNKVNGVDYYGMPPSIAGLRYQVLEGKSAQYNIDNFENNMIMGGMLIFKSAMTQTEAQANAKNILSTHVGAGKVGRIALISSESGLSDVEFKPFETQKEGSYIELDKRIEEKIITANNWDSILAGLNRSSTLGNGSAYIRSIWDVKEASLLKPLRVKLIEKVVVPIMKIYADVFNAPEIAKYEYDFATSMPFSFMGDVDPESFMMVDEARKLAGMPEHPDKKIGKMLLALVKQKSSKNVQTEPTTTPGANNN